MIILLSYKLNQQTKYWMVKIIVKILLIVGSIVLPSLMVYVQYRWRVIDTLFNLLMIISITIFGNIAALSIHNIIMDDTVFMTKIHGIFLNPLFLATGAYIGVYTIYRLMLLQKKAS